MSEEQRWRTFLAKRPAGTRPLFNRSGPRAWPLTKSWLSVSSLCSLRQSPGLRVLDMCGRYSPELLWHQREDLRGLSVLLPRPSPRRLFSCLCPIRLPWRPDVCSTAKGPLLRRNVEKSVQKNRWRRTWRQVEPENHMRSDRIRAPRRCTETFENYRHLEFG